MASSMLRLARAANQIPGRARVVSMPLVRSVHHMSSFRARKKAQMKKWQENPMAAHIALEEAQKQVQQLGIRRASIGAISMQGKRINAVDAYIPPEGELKKPLYTLEGLSQLYTRVKMAAISTIGVFSIRRQLKGFHAIEFAREVEKVYNKVNTCLAKNDFDPLKEVLTGDMYMDLLKDASSRMKNRTGTWEPVKELDRPRIVHCRVTYMESKKNLWVQTTVRIAQTQRFSNHIFNKHAAKTDPTGETTADIIDYVVVERHLSNPEGKWRIAGKITPKALPPISE